MIRKPRCSHRSGCFRTSPHTPESKDHAARRRKWLPVSAKNGVMAPPFFLRTDGQSKFGTSVAQTRDSVAFFFIMTMPLRAQQQQRLAFSVRERERCCCCCTHRIRWTSLHATSSFLPEVKRQLRVLCLRAPKTHECSRGLFKTYTNQPWLRSRISGFTAGKSALLLKGRFLKQQQQQQQQSNSLSGESSQ